MNPNTLEHWANRGWLLEATLLDAPGEIINTGLGPYYIGEKPEIGYIGNSQPLNASRYVIGMKLGRPLSRYELVRFRSADKKNLRLSNLILHSKDASAADLYRVNGDPILGYSHCLCECGTPLELDEQAGGLPRAYAEGHRPKSFNDAPEGLKRARPQRRKVLLENFAKIGQSVLARKEEQRPMPVTPLPATLSLPEPSQRDDSLKEFRALFEKLIQNLPWEEFKELLHLLLEIQARQEKKS